MTPTANDVIVTVSWAVVRGKAKRYPYFEPIVARATPTKNGLRWRTEDRPCRARRSEQLAHKDAKGVIESLKAQGLTVFYRETRGSMHNVRISTPIPEIAAEFQIEEDYRLV